MDFYRINEDYNRYLQNYEKENRGVTKVPNIRYTDRNKFAFGAVLQVNGMNYYVSVSSFDKKQEANILIRVPGDKKEIKGSLRFNYMIPVPEECIERLIIKDVEDEKYRLLLNKEYQFCMDNAERIQKKANKIYDAVKNELEKENKKLDIHMCETFKESIELAKRIAKPGQIVLFSPASTSFDMFKDMYDRGNKFKEEVYSI